MKVYYLRHQAGGILTDYPFSKPPTGEQTKAISALMAATHGTKNKKDGADYWMIVVEKTVLEPNDIPAVTLPTADSAKGSSASVEMGRVEVTATGTVTNPKT